MIRFWTFHQRDVARGQSQLIPLPGLRRYLALANDNIYWIAPNTGSATADIPASTQYLLWQKEDGGYGVALPLISGGVKAALRGAADGVTVTFQGALPEKEREDAALLCVGEGDDPYTLTREAVAAASRILGSFRLRTQKRTPALMERLGWCTWNAFYGAVDEAKLLAGLDSFHAAGFPLGFMLIDDGAWDQRGEYLCETRAHPGKFPDGLKPLIRRAKERYGLRQVGVWHHFAGYWAGIDPHGPLAERYTLLHSRANIHPWEAEPSQSELYFVSPDEIDRFYTELHGYLRGQEVDFVKIDGQCTVSALPPDAAGKEGAMAAYQQAMQNAAERCFGGQVIHCMCNSVDVAYNMKKTNCWRNSDDYIPGTLRKQQEHLYINAMNSLWSSCFAVPDWDMFQSHAPGASIHAAARAISGGPVYVSDVPGQQDFPLLRRLVTSDGLLLRCDQIALPAPDCLFTDCRKERALLKIFNFCGRTGVLGAFNCTEEDGVSGLLRAADIPGLAGERFAVYLQHSGQVRTVRRDQAINVTLAPDEYALAFFAPIRHGVAPLGLLDKYNAAAAVVCSDWRARSLRTELLDGGKIGFFCDKRPARVLCNGATAAEDYDEESGLLCVHTETGGRTVVEIEL